MDRCSLGHHLPSWSSGAAAALPPGSPSSLSESWEVPDEQGLTGAAQPWPHTGSPSSWGTSLTSDVVCESGLFRSPWLGCSAAPVLLTQLTQGHEGRGHWVRECSSPTPDLGQRFVPADVHLLTPAGGGFPAPAAPPTGWGHLKGETFQGAGCPFGVAGKERRGWMLDFRRQPEGIHSSLIVDGARNGQWKYFRLSISLYLPNKNEDLLQDS